MMGMGTDNVIKIDFEKTTPEEFEEIVVNNNVFMINSTFGTTSEGTIESVDKFSAVKLNYICVLDIVYMSIYHTRQHSLLYIIC